MQQATIDENLDAKISEIVGGTGLSAQETRMQ